MLTQILDKITRIAAALDKIAASSITPAQAQQVSDALEAVAVKAESLAGATSPTP